MRRSIPKEERENKEIRNSVSKNENQNINGQNSTIKIRRCTGTYHNDSHMHYGESLKTGATSGGHIWNPPLECINRVFVHMKTGDRWVDCATCKSCKNYCGDKQNPACTLENVVRLIKTSRRRS